MATRTISQPPSHRAHLGRDASLALLAVALGIAAAIANGSVVAGAIVAVAFGVVLALAAELRDSDPRRHR